MFGTPGLLALVLLAVACGDAEDIDPGPPNCAGDHVGEWSGDTLADALVLTDDCDVSYVGIDGCRWVGIYRLSEGGGMVLDVRESEGGACPGRGSLECGLSVSVSGDRLQWRCRGTTLEYSRSGDQG